MYILAQDKTLINAEKIETAYIDEDIDNYVFYLTYYINGKRKSATLYESEDKADADAVFNSFLCVLYNGHTHFEVK